jgi:hypothetical protein
MAHRVERAEAATAKLVAMFAAGGRWGRPEHGRIWKDTLEALAKYKTRSGYEVWRYLRYYPACLALYSGGVAALSASNYSNLRLLLEDCRSEEDGKAELLARRVAPDVVLRKDWANEALGVKRRTPMNERVAAFLRPVLAELAGSEDFYEDLFDSFEFLVAMTCADRDREYPWFPLGRFVHSRYDAVVPGIPAKSEEITEQWPPLASGMFAGDVARARRAHGVVRRAWNEMNWR